MKNFRQEILKLAKKKDISKMSFREIMREIGAKNPQTIIYHLEKLKEKGLLHIDTKGRQRVSKPKAFAVDNFFNIPVVGAANCGPALELAHEDIQSYLKISQKLLKRSKPDGLIAVKAIGDSLNRAEIGENKTNIDDGDYVIVDCKQQSENGDYVLSVINDAANFKRFYKNDEEIKLISESTLDIPPIILHEEDVNTSGYIVNGVIVKVIKN
jgi:SOS-response transcriptional repressor LexA